MIEQTFLFLDRIGNDTEQKLWKAGVTTWDAFLSRTMIPGFSKKRKMIYDLQLLRAKRALVDSELAFFTSRLPKGEHWRLYDLVKDDTIFLDIETSERYGDITIIGLYDGNEPRVLVRGFNLDRENFLDALANHKCVITFNGSSFDMPILERFFRENINLVHIDLRHMCSKVGLNGGLKIIERLLEIHRDEDAYEDAIYLWHMWQASGDREYLDRLIRYNEFDVVNLKPLTEHIIAKYRGKMP